MIETKDVRGTAETAAPIVVAADAVYLHTNVRTCDDGENARIYDEVCYTKDEYLALVAEQAIAAQAQFNALAGVRVIGDE